MATWLERLLASHPMKRIAAEPDWQAIVDELERDAAAKGPEANDEPTVEYSIPTPRRDN